ELDVDAAGNVVFAGNSDGLSLDLGAGPTNTRGPFLIKYDNGGNVLWSKAFNSGCCTYPMTYLAVDRLGYSLFTGAFTFPLDLGTGDLTPNGGQDIFVAKYAP